MEAKDKARLTVQNEPEVVFLALYLTTVSSACHSSELKLSAGMSCKAMFWNIGAEVGTPVTDVVWDTWTFITVCRINAILRNEFLPR